MGGNVSSRHVSFDPAYDEEGVTFVKGIRLSQRVIDRMKESPPVVHPQASPKSSTQSTAPVAPPVERLVPGEHQVPVISHPPSYASTLVPPPVSVPIKPFVPLVTGTVETSAPPSNLIKSPESLPNPPPTGDEHVAILVPDPQPAVLPAEPINAPSPVSSEPITASPRVELNPLIGSSVEPVTPIGSSVEPLTPIGSSVEHVTPIGSSVEPVTPIGSSVEPLTPIGSSVEPVTPIGSSVEPVTPIGSSVEPLTPIGSSVEPVTPIGSSVEPVTPIGSSVEPLTPIGSSVEPLTPIGSSVEPLTPIESSVEPITPIESSVEPVKQTPIESSVEPAIISAEDLVPSAEPIEPIETPSSLTLAAQPTSGESMHLPVEPEVSTSPISIPAPIQSVLEESAVSQSGSASSVVLPDEMPCKMQMGPISTGDPAVPCVHLVEEPVAPQLEVFPLETHVVNEEKLKRHLREDLQKLLNEEMKMAEHIMRQQLEEEKAKVKAQAQAAARLQIQDEVQKLLEEEKASYQQTLADAIRMEKLKVQDEHLITQYYWMERKAQKLEEKEKDLENQEALFREQIAKMQEKMARFTKVTAENYKKGLEDAHKRFRRCQIKPVCSDLQSQILKCYAENKGQTMSCSNIASLYIQCVDCARQDKKLSTGG
ncbi:coiled-coil-helix-coiled-coil-helix domain containing 3b isoform X1 [Carassius carassius]|uniref:coiled-coil-helix-coiled-coil-helix domain containing 3b isoform X1 n=1 Tax=Carassius carassius TaxID=217509 RepID=UPI0028689275|nr:coiled-coil-helix-coiled-coil-helix domain containing 3b isoform X1 [Carassius carassius]